MLAILGITVPIFSIILLGFLTVRTGTLSPLVVRGMGHFVVTFALPALLFGSLASRSLDETLNMDCLAALTLTGVATFLLSVFVAGRWRGKSLRESAFHGLGSAMSNSIFIGMPILLQLFGSQASIVVALAVIVETCVLLPLTLSLAELSGQRGQPVIQVLRILVVRTLRNPLILAILLGMLAGALEIPLPGPVRKIIELLGGAATALSLLVIGGSMVGQSLRGQRVDLAQMVGFKLFVHPLMAVLVITLLPPFDPLLQTSIVIIACLPMAGVFPVLAQAHGQGSVASTALVIAVVTSFLTISLVMLGLEQFGRIS